MGKYSFDGSTGNATSDLYFHYIVPLRAEVLMHRNSYTKEIGVDAGTKTIPFRYAVVLLGIIAVGIWYGAGVLQTRFDERQAAKKMAAAAEASANVHSSVAKK